MIIDIDTTFQWLSIKMEMDKLYRLLINLCQYNLILKLPFLAPYLLLFVLTFGDRFTM